jgi:aryl-alcohol dehydrogenase-like predicted oxidoreductase
MMMENDRMHYRQLRGIEISEIGIGCYSLSGVYGHKDVAEFRRMLVRAYEQGVTLFDTAEGYGDAEQILGESVRPFRDEVIIATKVGVRSGSKPDLSAEYVTNACESSLRRLQTDTIDLYQVHFDDAETPVEETVAALERLKERGLIRHYGLGHLPMRRVRKYLQWGNPTFMLMELSAVTTDAREALLPFCRRHQLPVIAFSTTGRGLLSGRYGRNVRFPPSDLRHVDPLFQRERLDHGIRVVQRLAAVGQRYGKTPAQTAIAWVLAQPGVACALSGPSTVAHLEENLGASGWLIARDDLDAFELFLERERERLMKVQQRTLEAIACQPLPEDTNEAFTDLLYAIETAVSTGLAAEDVMMPLLHVLFAARDENDGGAKRTLHDVQEQLGQIVGRAGS